MNNFCIYCYTNKINNKKYIGQSRNIGKRCHPSNYKGCIKFYNALQKYGIENFDFEILEIGLTLEEANAKEEEYIIKFNTIENGYNIKSGGKNNLYTEESKQKMSNSCKTKQKIICLETKEIYESAKQIEKILGFANTNIIACCRGKLHTAYGYHWQYFDQDKQKEFETSTDKRKKKVFCIEKNMIFESASEAGRILNISRPNITKCCQNKLQTAGGFHWRYA